MIHLLITLPQCAGSCKMRLPSFDLQMGIPHMSRKVEYGTVALVFNISLFFLTLPPLSSSTPPPPTPLLSPAVFEEWIRLDFRWAFSNDSSGNCYFVLCDPSWILAFKKLHFSFLIILVCIQWDAHFVVSFTEVGWRKFWIFFFPSLELGPCMLVRLSVIFPSAKHFLLLLTSISLFSFSLYYVAWLTSPSSLVNF